MAKPHQGQSIYVELNNRQGNVPEWCAIFPAPDADGWVQGVDGRRFHLRDPEAVLRLTRERNAKLALDYNHGSELLAPKGHEAPAAGWFTDFRIAADGSIEAKLEPTERARNAIAAKEYRYLSPVPVLNKQTREVLFFSSVGLTPKPNFHALALNHEDTHQADPIMNEEQLKELCRALGIPETSSVEAVLKAAKAAKETNAAATPSLEKFVPRADYDAVTERALNAEKALKAKEAEALEAEINTEIEAATKAGKITPATADFYRETCRAEGGLEKFRAFIKDAPAIGDASKLDGKQPPSDTSTELNAEERAVCEQMGICEEEFLATRKAEASA